MNVFSNSFDEGAPSLDLKPQRNCKSSTRMLNKTQQGYSINQQMPIPLIHNVSAGSGMLTAGSLNRKQGSFNNFMKTKQIQSSYQQAILSQLQMQRANTQNSFDMNQTVNDRDLSNRSVGVLTPGGSQNMNNSFIVNQYFGKTMNSSNMPITPHGLSCNIQAIQQIAGSSGSQIPRTNQSGEQQSMDPYTYLRWKQQKYKSCRSNQATGNAQINKQNAHIIANSAYLLQQKKGNQTQKTKNNNKSICSSTGSALGSASMTTTMTGIKSLSEVKNPSMFIQWRFSDRKLTELVGISQFKNLTDLDISGNMLQTEITELKQLQFLKKLNLSNNQISDLYPLPHNLEILNISSNILKRLNPEVTSMLKNLSTLDISSNGLETLEGIQNIKRLKRLLCKNNQVIDLQPLQDVSSIIELDLENNPVDSFKSILYATQNKKDLLILNIKMSPIILMINTYDQLISEITQATSHHDQALLDNLKQKLKLFSNGTLYRSKRVYIKIKTMQQHSKRSSSNFSNGSSSCGRAGANTGGRNNQTTVQGNNSANQNAFSPLLNNTVTTPNYQHISQRLEDIEQLYDEILDEEEEIERKQLRMQKRKLKKQGLIHEKDEDSEDDDESLYEDEEYNNPSMSCEEDLDDLQSFRNHGNMANQFLNESTADFNKEIKMINQELREQLTSELDNFGANPDHTQSLHSTQTVSTTKKNLISFKLDLSKCTQQQSEDDDFDHVKGINEEDEENFEIPDLQFIKVTDDSFRQMQKQQSQQQSLRNKLDKPTAEQIAQTAQKYTEREQVTKASQIQQKQVVIPKLQLGVLQQNQSQQSFKPIQKPASICHQDDSSSMKSLQNLKILQEPELSSRREELCKNPVCSQMKSALQSLKDAHEKESKQQIKDFERLMCLIVEIKSLVKYDGDIFSLANFIKTQRQEQTNNQNEIVKLNIKCEDLEKRIIELQKRHDDYSKNEEQEKLISQLRQQLSFVEKDPLSTRLSGLNGNMNILRLNSFELKRAQSTNQEQVKPSPQNPSYFYQTEQQVKDPSSRIEKQLPQDSNQTDQIQPRSRKRVACDIKRVKRPQSVVGHRKSSYCVKINSLLRIDQSMTGADNGLIDDSQYANEYGSTQEYPKSGGDRAITQLSQTSTRKVGHFIERLKERNSSLQERLNGSFGSINNPLQNGVSPLNLQKVNLNLTQQQDLSCNPYIISPNNEDAAIKGFLPQSATNQLNSISSFTNQLLINQKAVNKQSKPESSSSLNDYSGRDYQASQANSSSQYNSKTQRISVKKVQYNQLFTQGSITKEDTQKSLNIKQKELSSNYQINFSNGGIIQTGNDSQLVSRPHANSSSFVEKSRKAQDLMNFYPSQIKDEKSYESNSKPKEFNNSFRDTTQPQISSQSVPTKQQQIYQQQTQNPNKVKSTSHSQW